ncbi:hypothetical protein HAX54_035892 [Datura stramonium]|uniref:Uncharacterized protein n=1 Tax=Datura stramonium TaxID=4076 RepID=A0ABS8VJU1_DATST|nr:hypothetical protein [Datura stramonium]
MNMFLSRLRLWRKHKGVTESFHKQVDIQEESEKFLGTQMTVDQPWKRLLSDKLLHLLRQLNFFAIDRPVVISAAMLFLPTPICNNSGIFNHLPPKLLNKEWMHERAGSPRMTGRHAVIIHLPSLNIRLPTLRCIFYMTVLLSGCGGDGLWGG